MDGYCSSSLIMLVFECCIPIIILLLVGHNAKQNFISQTTTAGIDCWLCVTLSYSVTKSEHNCGLIVDLVLYDCNYLAHGSGGKVF